MKTASGFSIWSLLLRSLGSLIALADAAVLPNGFKETKLIGGINPSSLQVAPDGRVFLCEKDGRVRIIKGDAVLAKPFVTLDVEFNQEGGLLGIALDPAFATNPWVYLYYTAKNPTHNRVSRFRASGDTATGSEAVLIDMNTRTGVGWHNGGAIHFAKDGKLLIATGNDVNRDFSQSMTVLQGKILRINPDGSIPSDNPFYNEASGANRAIWALGLRNPFTAAVHPVSGRYFINDVGDGSAEEINEGSAGANFGYPRAEGKASAPPTGLKGTYRDPVSQYGRSGAGGGCAVTGGVFYQPAANSFGPEFSGVYFFSDYCSGWIRSLDPKNGNAIAGFATGITRPINLSVGPDGSLYYVNRGNRAPGVSNGSPQDNTATQDGGLFRIKGPVTPTTLSPLGRSAFNLPLLGKNAWLALPPGKRHLSLHDLAGRKVWEFHGAGGSETVWVNIPPSLTGGLHQAVIE